MTAWHHTVLALLFLVLGCCVGSFLNVCVYRVPRSLSLFRPRSRCPGCLTAIRARDNLPVLGWLLLRGRCRHCGGAISPRYAAIELTVGLLFAGLYLAAVGLARGDLWEQAGAWIVLTSLLAAWTVIGLAVVVALVGYDTQWGLRAPDARAWHRGAGREVDPSRAGRSPAADPGSTR
jgi:leader peptidase (prepilin peptidase)/N-methyltransferase